MNRMKRIDIQRAKGNPVQLSPWTYGIGMDISIIDFRKAAKLQPESYPPLSKDTDIGTRADTFLIAAECNPAYSFRDIPDFSGE